MSKRKIEKCPLCGFSDIYVGATAVECGYTNKCKNWTQKQANVVKELFKKQEAAAEIHKNNNLGWDEDEETTSPSGGFYLYDGFSD